MAKGSKGQTISSISDIMGFLLEESKKPPEKRHPIQPKTGSIQGDSEYVSTLVEALALPGTFVGDKYLDEIQNMIDPAVKIDTYKDRIGTAKIKASDLPKFFDNPDKFIDDLFEGRKTISNKLQRIQWAGEQMRMLQGSAYAKREKLFDSYPPEMRETLIRAMGQTAMKSGQRLDQIWIEDAMDQIQKNGVLSSKIQPLKKEYSRLSEQKRILEESKRKVPQYIKDDLARVSRRLKDLGYGDFSSLLQNEFRAKQDSILNGRSWDNLTEREQKEYLKLSESSNMLELWKRYDGLPKGKKEFQREKQRLQFENRQLEKQKRAVRTGGIFDLNGKKYDYGSLTNSERKKLLKEINGEIRGTNKAIGSLRGMQVWGNLGALEGTYYGITSTFGPGGLAAIANGSFYDPKKGFFGCPSIEGTLEYDFKDDKKIGIAKGERIDRRDIKFTKARRDKYWVKDSRGIWREKDRKLLNTYNEAMVTLYYYNPATLIKTLYTGERFAWMADKKKTAIEDMFGISDNSGVLAAMKTPKFWNFYSGYKNADPAEQARLIATNPEYSILLKKIEFFIKKNPDFLKKVEKAQKLAKQFEKLKGVAKVFSGPQTVLNALQNFANNRTRSLRTFLSEKVFKKIFKGDKVAQELLGEWAKKGGGKVLLAGMTKAITTAIINLIGITSAAFTGGVSFIVSTVLSGFLEKISKVAIKVFLYALVGVIGVIILIAGIFTFGNNAETDGFSRQIAGEVKYNSEFASYGYSSNYTGNNGVLPIEVPPPTNSSCPLGDSGYYCTQGYTDTTCSHVNITAQLPVDLSPVTYFYAPQYCDSYTCTATHVVDPGRCNDGNYTGQAVLFYDGNGNVFKMLHAKYIAPSNNRNYKGGEPVAYFYQTFEQLYADDPLQQTKLEYDDDGNIKDFLCWTGNHIHLTITHNGTFIDPISFLYNMGCSGPATESQCSSCH
ncbi:MAG: hypothetical protein PHP08_02290 [Candidatus Dojkabacteria bacterium]|nr:hypothetical protein [Candidatus Dojkabacteria bacterium]